ncbi:MAG: YqgE/AlgH family protein [Acidimicrobiia bacterium]|nr:YqgE/AlgH family protein [Acidimicrobiia bacterium]
MPPGFPAPPAVPRPTIRATMSPMEERSHRGRLLVATPGLGDPNFDRTVILLLEHDDDGAAGVVLNRPSDVEVAVPLPGWAPLATSPKRIFVGGPVAQGAVIGLAHADGETMGDAWVPLGGGLATVDLEVSPDSLAPPPSRLRVFTGYSGWSAGQLERELESGSWFVVDARADDPFALDPAGLWGSVVNRQPTDRGPARVDPPPPLGRTDFRVASGRPAGPARSTRRSSCRRAIPAPRGSRRLIEVGAGFGVAPWPMPRW